MEHSASLFHPRDYLHATCFSSRRVEPSTCKREDNYDLVYICQSHIHPSRDREGRGERGEGREQTAGYGLDEWIGLRSTRTNSCGTQCWIENVAKWNNGC